MGAKRYKPEEIISKLREAEVLLVRRFLACDHGERGFRFDFP